MFLRDNIENRSREKERYKEIFKLEVDKKVYHIARRRFLTFYQVSYFYVIKMHPYSR